MTKFILSVFQISTQLKMNDCSLNKRVKLHRSPQLCQGSDRLHYWIRVAVQLGHCLAGRLSHKRPKRKSICTHHSIFF